ncbi:hypothetical protein AB4Z29_20615 [Paenibacillus sp. 2TAB23]|uniref:hypothetical protein n=1 Tax=Paenibacillus sp. 2TAB23 TaxID=3233004 RepID=UPI003F9882E1
MNSRILAGHMIRWLIIALASFVLCAVLFSQSSFRVEEVARKALNMLELPYAPVSERVKTGQGYELLQIVDKENGMYHHLYVRRTLGLFWSYRGGGSGTPFKDDTVINFQGGYSTFGKYRHHYYMGQVVDPKVNKVRIVWWDGEEQDAAISNGTYLAARSYRIPKKEAEATGTNRLFAYDTSGAILYELDEEKREIKKTAEKQQQLF